MENLRAWLENVDASCGSVLREPTSGLHKMNLALTLRRSKYVLKAPIGRGQKIDQLVAHLAETVDAVRCQVWDAPDAYRAQYLESLRRMIEGLRREVVALIAETKGRQTDLIISPTPDQPLSSRRRIETIVSTSAAGRRSLSAASGEPSRQRPSCASSATSTGLAFWWIGFTTALGKVIRKV